MIRINLLGHEAKKPKRRSSTDLSIGGGDNVVYILAVVGTIALLGAAWWWQSSSLVRYRAEHAAIVAEQAQLAETAERVRLLEDRRATVNQRLGVIIDLKKSQSGPVLLLDHLSQELPDSLWITNVTVAEGGVSIIGQALSEVAVTDFGRNLRLSSFFADTNIQFTQDTGDSVRFQLSTRFVPLAGAVEDEGEGTEAVEPSR